MDIQFTGDELFRFDSVVNLPGDCSNKMKKKKRSKTKK